MTPELTPEQSKFRDQVVEEVNRAAYLAFTGQEPEPGQSAVHFPHDDPTPAQAVVLARLAGQRHAGATILCEHADPANPLPMAWLAWWPAVIRCTACALAAATAATTAEGGVRPAARLAMGRCSKCQATGGLTTCSTMLPAEWTADPLGAVGPIIASLRLCRRCLPRAVSRHVPLPSIVLTGS